MKAVDQIKLASIAVDLDGTLAFHLSGKFNPKVIGKPITAMLKRVREWMDQGEIVKIFTARASNPKNIPPVKKWLKQHGLGKLQVTNLKTPDIKHIWDDRAVSVQENTGKVIKAARIEKDYGDLEQLQEGDLLDYVVQRHQAQVAGPHLDLRMGRPDTGLYSWTSKGEIPEPGQKSLVVRQPLHKFRYRNFEGEIPKGRFGGGKVTKERAGKLRIVSASPTEIHFSTADGRNQFALVKPKGPDQNWLLIRGGEADVTKAATHDQIVSIMEARMAGVLHSPDGVGRERRALL